MRTMILAVALTALAFQPLEAADESPLSMSYLETEDLKLLYFDPTLNYLVPHAARTFTNSLEWQRRVFGWVPYEPTTVALTDFGDYGNAVARSAPNNALMFNIAPLSHAFETFPASERIYSLMNHELVHVATMDMWNSQDARWRRFFRGKILPDGDHPETILYSYLTVPRTNVPRWHLEGSAVFMETWMGGGIGRAQGAYDEMVFRAMVRDGAQFYDTLGLVSRGVRVDFQVGVNAYLYGTRFMTWLAYEHSPEHLVAWLRRDEDTARYYTHHFRDVFGTSLDDAWQQWIEFEHEYQARNLEQVRLHPVTPYRELVPRALGSVSRAYVDEDKGVMYGGFLYPGVIAHLGALEMESGAIRRLVDIKGPMLYRVTSLAFDAERGTLFYTTDNDALRDVVAVDVDSGKQTELLKDARIGELVFNPADRSLWGVRHLNGFASLVRIPYPYSEWNMIHVFPYGMVPYDLDISAGGRLLSASVGEVTGDQFLRVWEIERLLEGDIEPSSQFDFGQAIPEGFVFSPDGRYLYGSSYYTGVSNIFRFEVESGEVEAVTNAESGFFRPIPLADGRLLVFTFTGAGFVPAMIDPEPVEHLSAISFFGTELANKHPVVTTWQVQPASAVDLDPLIISEGPYRPGDEMRLQNAHPVILGYKDSVAGGWHFNVEDALGFTSISTTISYSPDDSLPTSERAHVNMRFRRQMLRSTFRAGASWNNADFYDLFGPTKRSRKGYSVSMGYDRTLIYDTPRSMSMHADVALHGQLDTLPDFQNIRAPFDRLVTAQLALNYRNTHHSLGAVDSEKGYTWDLVAGASHVSGDIIPKLRGGLDMGVPLPLPHSSVWLRNAAGIAHGDRDDPFANFFFGGFGNNYVDKASIKRYREFHAFPGFELNEVGGRNFARTMLEVNLPPAVFEGVGSPGFYLAWLRPSVFASVLSVNPDSSTARTTVRNLGAQVDLRFTLLHKLDMTLSAGYASGFRRSDRVSDEWMLSLKIM